MDMGGYVIIINADKVVVTGNKVNQKLYRSHPTAKPGTLKTENFKQLNQVPILLMSVCELLLNVWPCQTDGLMFRNALDVVIWLHLTGT